MHTQIDPFALKRKISSAERQKGLTTNHLHTQIDPFASELRKYNPGFIEMTINDHLLIRSSNGPGLVVNDNGNENGHISMYRRISLFGG